MKKEMTTNEYLHQTYRLELIPTPRPFAVCEDGFTISIQASIAHYCIPRVTGDIEYERVELGYPNIEDDLIKEYAESDNYTNTVYGYVPVEVVDQLLKKHGGIIKCKNEY